MDGILGPAPGTAAACPRQCEEKRASVRPLSVLLDFFSVGIPLLAALHLRLDLSDFGLGGSVPGFCSSLVARRKVRLEPDTDGTTQAVIEAKPDRKSVV